MDEKVLFKLSYGLFVLTSFKEVMHNGCIVNTVTQLASDPLTISVAVNKENLTCQMIKETKKMTVSVISEDADFELFKHFGFQSGREVDKFADFKDCKKVYNDTMAITKGTNAYISLYVVSEIDLGSHILFIARPTDGEILSDVPSATYDYYFKNIKPKPQNTVSADEGKTVWRCKICGYEYVGEELPEDYICPLCKHPASDFEKV